MRARVWQVVGLFPKAGACRRRKKCSRATAAAFVYSSSPDKNDGGKFAARHLGENLLRHRRKLKFALPTKKEKHLTRLDVEVFVDKMLALRQNKASDEWRARQVGFQSGCRDRFDGRGVPRLRARQASAATPHKPPPSASRRRRRSRSKRRSCTSAAARSFGRFGRSIARPAPSPPPSHFTPLPFHFYVSYIRRE